MVLATGDFFGPSSGDFGGDELKELLENKLEGCYVTIFPLVLAKATSSSNPGVYNAGRASVATSCYRQGKRIERAIV